jgi:hypothetical protein
MATECPHEVVAIIGMRELEGVKTVRQALDEQRESAKDPASSPKAVALKDAHEEGCLRIISMCLETT